MEQMRGHNQAEMEIIDHTDFFGQIKSGMYKEGICLWDLDENGGYFCRLSPVSRWFLPEAELMIELKKAALYFTGIVKRQCFWKYILMCMEKNA